jgi:hypothetical protein
MHGWKASAIAHRFFAFPGRCYQARFGSGKSYRSGVETLLVGGAAAVLAYPVGLALGGLAR